MLIQGTKVTVPGPPGGADRVLDLESIFMAEARQGEIAIVTPVKAPELLALFNKAWLDTDKLVKDLVASKVENENEVEKRRATILLYEAKEFLKSQGIESTKDTRDAVIVLDPEYQRLQDRVNQLQAVAEWLKGKVKFFENLFTGVKKIMGDDAYNMSTRVGNKNLSGTGGNFDVALAQATKALEVVGTGRFTKPEPTTTKPSSGYGKSRYDR